MKKTKNLTYLALFMAIEAVMVLVPFLGFIPIGPLRATTLHIPVIIAAIVLGTKEGAAVGLIFGIFSMVNNTVNPTVTSFAFSPFISGNILSAVIAIVPRVLIGVVSGYVYKLLKDKWPNGSMVISSFLGALTNTVLVLGGIWLLFGHAYAKALGRSFNSLAPYFISIISTQSIFEAVVGAIIATAVAKALLKFTKRG